MSSKKLQCLQSPAIQPLCLALAHIREQPLAIATCRQERKSRDVRITYICTVLRPTHRLSYVCSSTLGCSKLAFHFSSFSGSEPVCSQPLNHELQNLANDSSRGRRVP